MFGRKGHKAVLVARFVYYILNSCLGLVLSKILEPFTVALSNTIIGSSRIEMAREIQDMRSC